MKPKTWVKIPISSKVRDLPLQVEYYQSAVVTKEGYCNTTNHHELAPADWPSVKTDYQAFMRRYNKECEPFMYTAWAEPLQMDDYLVVSLPKSSVSCLSEAGRVSILTDDMQDLADMIDTKIKKAGEPWCLPTSSFFVRLDDCSPKDNGGLRPLKTGQEILTQILGSKRCMLRVEYAQREKLADVKLILKLWRPDIDSGNEFRVFVNDGVITALSQYHWYADSGWGREPKKSKIPFVVEGIHQLFDQIKDFLPFKSCVYDTHVKFIEEPEGEVVFVELVEFNPFGAHISSGSALFHWERDFEILNGLNREPTTPVFAAIGIQLSAEAQASAVATCVAILHYWMSLSQRECRGVTPVWSFQVFPRK